MSLVKTSLLIVLVLVCKTIADNTDSHEENNENHHRKHLKKSKRQVDTLDHKSNIAFKI